jgi:hypothetical protein
MESHRRLSNFAWVYIPNTLIAAREILRAYALTGPEDHTLTLGLGRVINLKVGVEAKYTYLTIETLDTVNLVLHFCEVGKLHNVTPNTPRGANRASFLPHR